MDLPQLLWQFKCMKMDTALDVKICGLKTAEAVRTACDGGASHIGFIFFEKSPRYISPPEAARLCEIAAGRAKTVAVTVDADDATLDRIVETMHPDILQLHGSETPARLSHIRARYNLPVMKAIAVREAADLRQAARYTGIADRILFDAKPPEGSLLPGGNGVSFDWSLLTGFDAGHRFMLSGGLDHGNIEEAVRIARPGGIDISSGVESAPGVKDIGLMAEFLHKVEALAPGETAPA